MLVQIVEESLNAIARIYIARPHKKVVARYTQSHGGVVFKLSVSSFLCVFSWSVLCLMEEEELC